MSKDDFSRWDFQSRIITTVFGLVLIIFNQSAEVLLTVICMLSAIWGARSDFKSHINKLMKDDFAGW